MIKSSSYRSSIVENDSCCITHNSFHNLSYLRGSVEIEAAFVLDVEHQVASIQVLHYKEEVLLCKNTLLSAHCHRQVRHEECVRKWIQIRGAGSVGLYQLGLVALTAVAMAGSLLGNMLVNVSPVQ